MFYVSLKDVAVTAVESVVGAGTGEAVHDLRVMITTRFALSVWVEKTLSHSKPKRVHALVQ